MEHENLHFQTNNIHRPIAVSEWEASNSYGHVKPGQQKRAVLAPINQTGAFHRYIVGPIKNTVKNLNDKNRRFEEDEYASCSSVPSSMLDGSDGVITQIVHHIPESTSSSATASYYRPTSAPSDLHALSSRFDSLHFYSVKTHEVVTMSSLPEFALSLILKHLDFKQHIKARLVCKHWNRISTKLNMQPVDEVAQAHDVLQVVEYSQEIIVNLLAQEAELWSPANANHMIHALHNQPEVTLEMRRVLVDWLIEVHFKFRLKPQTLYTAISLVNRVLYNSTVPRRDLQTVGVAAIMVAAKFEERFAPSINDLVYITSQSSTRQRIVERERDILAMMNYELTLPSAWSFVNRFTKVMGLTRDEQMMANYFIDLTLPEAAFAHIRPSLIVIGAMYLLRQLQHREPWHDKYAFYSGYSEDEVRQMASSMLQAAKMSKSTSVPKKYKTSTYCGVTPAVQELLAAITDYVAM